MKIIEFFSINVFVKSKTSQTNQFTAKQGTFFKGMDFLKNPEKVKLFSSSFLKALLRWSILIIPKTSRLAFLTDPV